VALSSTKTLPELSGEWGVDLETMLSVVRDSGILHGHRSKQLESGKIRLVTLHSDEIDRLKALIDQQRSSGEGRLGARAKPASDGKGPRVTATGVKVTQGRRRRTISRPAPAVQAPAEPAVPAQAPQAEAQPRAEMPAAEEDTPPRTAHAAGDHEPEAPAPSAQAPQQEAPPAPDPARAEQDPKPEAPPAAADSSAPAAARAKESPAPKKAPQRGKKPREKADFAADDKHGRKRKQGKGTLTVTDQAKAELRLKKRRKQQRIDHMPKVHGFQKPVGRVVRDIEIPETISLQVLAQRMAVKATEIVSELFRSGTAVTINSYLDQDTAAYIVHEFGHNPVLTKEQDFRPELSAPDDLVEEPRPPVVTVMGHVDHGKTSLLDRIRQSKVVEGEAGGITQHMGAYRVETPKGKILFIDTPGHELFTEMRARGAKVTDIIVLVVAADDGVMPQTLEAINHAKAEDVPIVVAINKMDKPEADPKRVIEQLAARGVAPEEWGGDNLVAKVSATKGEGIGELLDAILLQSEMLELKAPVNVPARGVAIEAYTDKGRGHLVTMIARGGEIKEGDLVVCDTEFGRVRTLYDEDGNRIEAATPSVPFVVQGLSGLPAVGSDFYVVDSEKRCREIVEVQRNKARAQKMAASGPMVVTDLSTLMREGPMGGQQVLNVIVKADVYGTLEAITQALQKETNAEAEIRIVHSGIGGITTSDVNLAHASMGRIVAFNVRPDGKARKLIEGKSVQVGYYSVIYEAIKDLRDSLSDMLSPISEEKFLGACKVLEVFRISKVGRIAGCLVEDGAVTDSCHVRVTRDGKEIYVGEIGTLKHFKDDVKEVRSGLECGIQMKRFQDFKPGDTLEAFDLIERAREFAAAESAVVAQQQ